MSRISRNASRISSKLSAASGERMSGPTVTIASAFCRTKFITLHEIHGSIGFGKLYRKYMNINNKRICRGWLLLYKQITTKLDSVRLCVHCGVGSSDQWLLVEALVKTLPWQKYVRVRLHCHSQTSIYKISELRPTNQLTTTSTRSDALATQVLPSQKVGMFWRKITILPVETSAR